MSADQPQPNLGILLREPYRIASERLHERFAESGHPEVRAPHGNVFAFLDDGGTRVSELARRAQITKQSMAELVAHLERNGYVERVPDPDDRRAKLVRSTARGSELYAIARALRRRGRGGVDRAARGAQDGGPAGAAGRAQRRPAARARFVRG